MDRTARAVGAAIAVSIALATGMALAIDESGRSAEKASSPSGTPSPSPSEASDPPLLRPNVRSLDADDLQIEVVGNSRRLRFSASLANLGPGPLLLRPGNGSGCAAGEHPAFQVLHQDSNEDGVFQSSDLAAERRMTGCMARHPDHDHWHFDAMAAYSLRRAGSGDVLVSRDKVSFCLRDNERVPGQPVVVRREHFGECTRTSGQGISPGWVDIYNADLSGQWLQLPRGLDSRVLCLDLEADPSGLLDETDETDNATSVALRVDGTEVRRVASSVCRE